MIHVYSFPNEELRDRGVKEGGKWLGEATDPKELMGLMDQSTEGEFIGYFKEKASISMDQALLELGAYWDEIIGHWVYDNIRM